MPASTQLTNLDTHSVVDGSTAVRGVSATQLAIATGTTGTTQPQTTAPPGNTVAPVIAPEDYRLRILNPDGCSRASCDLFIGIDTNTGDDGFLDIYMEGTAAGWVAVGFSETPNMVSKLDHKYVYLLLCLCVLHTVFSGCGIMQQTGRHY